MGSPSTLMPHNSRIDSDAVNRARHAERYAAGVQGAAMSHTQEKLAEAAFFLRQMREHEKGFVEAITEGRLADRRFRYFTSAFITAARSVTWVMRAEFGHIPGWEEWFSRRQPADEDKWLLDVFTSVRNSSQKVAPVVPAWATSPKALPHSDNTAPSVKSRNPAVVVIFPSAANPDDSPVLVELGGGSVYPTLQELNGGHLLDACVRYHQLLQDLCTECHTRFPLSAA